MTGVHRLHVEVETEQCRVRLRRADGLQARRYHADCGLGEALDDVGLRLGLCPPADARFLCRVADRTWLVRIDSIATSNGRSWLLAALPHNAQAPMLDELVDDAEALATLRAVIAQKRGLVLLTGDDPHSLSPLATAIAQSCIAPDRKVLRVEPVARHALAGAVQVGLDALTPERREATCRALLVHDADVIVADAGLPPRIGPVLDTLAAEGRLVVRVIGANAIADALIVLRGDGANGSWLAEHLVALVRMDELRLLCAACRHPVSIGPDAIPVGANALEQADASPAMRLLATSLARFARSDGCPECHGTGIGEVRAIVDVLPIDAATRDDLRAEAFPSAAARLSGSRRAPTIAHTLARRGQVAIEEAGRLSRD